MNNQCYYCGKEFEAKRDIAKYCSNSCRTSANKQRRKNEKFSEKWRQEKANREAEAQRLKDEQREKRKQKALLKQEEKEKAAEIASTDILTKKQEADQGEADVIEINKQPEAENQQKLEKSQSDALELKKPALQKLRFQKTESIDQSVQKIRNRIAVVLIGFAFAYKIIESVFIDPKDKSKNEDKTDPPEGTKN
jgi:hypothetical protein